MQKNWHTISLAEVFSKTESRKEGLTNSEVNQRLKEFGHNVLPQEKPYSKIWLFLSQFNSPLMYILLATVVISLSLKHYSDTMRWLQNYSCCNFIFSAASSSDFAKCFSP